ncbi:hypothetical protein DZF92_11505 [Clavibacter michiganensis subsp. insidiosus]|uniref:Uncharacterized protein n=1 Tax=Clavibacter michiganensis subsp. insidiosus TaxID=33014 RepID=A0A399SNB6_9MICO|nr:hypothetical protein B5P21_15340 [Clavibacter michiganensis subsp. insidiosus]RII86185.1 hypothetical protein DZF92_11505 [Clavibacter michiganensis subsp. insidiosus]RIJ43355.1 hypothetical protein DZF93_06800 [Clavibacter michiganensis subsp. insidiosus]RMC86185.1 hypothetical protein CmiCFBP2404_06145 [Clavibacter michiganensis subsp. insidiosus]
MAFTGCVHTIHYADGRYLTGDDIARAVVECAQALAREGMAAATVTVPVWLPQGGVGAVAILIGPASQIVVEPVGPSEDELRDPEAVERIRALTVRARQSQSGTSVSADRQDGTVVPGLEDLD